MEFARAQLEKHGWCDGTGLGRNESGIKEALKVKLKFDTAGVGHNAGDQFSHHWWDHMFNKAANNIQVENSEAGVHVQQKEEFTVTNRKVSDKVLAGKDLLYGRFIKAATLEQGELVGEAKAEESSSEESDDEPEQPFGNLSDEQLLKVCGGRTAHKAARHGLKLNGKLARIMEQEALHAGSTPEVTPDATPNVSSDSGSDGGKQDRNKKKKKKRKAREQDECIEETVKLSEEKKKKKKKSKKNKSEESLESEKLNTECCEEEEQKESKKKKKKKDSDISSIANEASCLLREESKKSKKKKRKILDDETLDEESNGLSDKTSRKRKHITETDDKDVCSEVLVNQSSKKSKKRKKKDKSEIE